MNFQQAFFDELSKLAAMRDYPDPKDAAADERHWKMRRNWSTAAGALGVLPATLTARKGRKLRTLAGAAIGASIGAAAGGPGAMAGGAIGARLAHGAYDRDASARVMREHLAKKK